MRVRTDDLLINVKKIINRYVIGGENVNGEASAATRCLFWHIIGASSQLKNHTFQLFTAVLVMRTHTAVLGQHQQDFVCSPQVYPNSPGVHISSSHTLSVTSGMEHPDDVHDTHVIVREGITCYCKNRDEQGCLGKISALLAILRPAFTITHLIETLETRPAERPRIVLSHRTKSLQVRQKATAATANVVGPSRTAQIGVFLFCRPSVRATLMYTREKTINELHPGSLCRGSIFYGLRN